MQKIATLWTKNRHFIWNRTENDKNGEEKIMNQRKTQFISSKKLKMSLLAQAIKLITQNI